ncbi:hypothetical protein [Rhizobium halophytocola]|uniref:Uncharacterized protein n=1 Tax=Rhizobium halophytocola TaxID=735519 RepID=A0ABS4DU92_9HYPH|nr:hypothetical protein [Rhizobium halophytocola]MBP1849257.1 hypothetical protein [Rhizobium halophytocola]
MSDNPKIPRETTTFDSRDRLILALYAELKAERETRQLLEAAIRDGDVSREVLSAMAADPIPVVTSDDIATIETMLDRDRRLTELASKTLEEQSPR